MATASETIAIYNAVLQRDPTDAELANFVANSQTSSGQSQQIDLLVNSSEANSTVDPIVRIYQATFGRVPDKAGLDFWTDFYRDSGDVGQPGATPTLTQINQGFVASTEFQARFPSAASSGVVTEDFLDALYQQTLGRAPDQAGKDFYLGKSIAATVTAFAQSSEFINLSNSQVNLFLSKAGNMIQDYDGSLFDTNDDGVVDDADTAPPAGQTYTLTNGVDNLTGTPNNDIFIARIDESADIESTLNPGDIIDGRGGVDTLRIFSNGDGDEASFRGATITNVERLEIIDTDDDLDTLDLFGQTFETVSIENRDGSENVDINDVAVGTDFEFVGQDGSSIDIDFDGDLDGDDDTVNLAFMNVKDIDVEILDDDNGDNVENVVATIDGDIDLTLEAEDGSGDGTLETVTITGSGDLDLTISSRDELVSVSAEVDGDVSTDLTGAANLETVTTGDGDDDVEVDNDDVSVSTGDGDDLLVASGGTGAMLDGGAGLDILGGDGNEKEMTGGADADEFHFSIGTIDNEIIDFTRGEDVISFLQSAGLNGLDFANSTNDTVRGDSDLDSADYQVRATVSDIVAADDQKVIEITTAVNAAEILTLDAQVGVEAFVLVYNSDVGNAQIYYTDGVVGGDMLVADLTNITTLGQTNAFNASDFDIYV